LMRHWRTAFGTRNHHGPVFHGFHYFGLTATSERNFSTKSIPDRRPVNSFWLFQSPR
jgi:hypothetical protein